MITQENIPYTDDEIKAMVKTCEKYNKALDRADTLMKKEGKKLNVISICKYIFPEFDTVSEDERIRKGLINGFNECLKDCPYPQNAVKYWHNIDINQILTWLEKQGANKEYVFRPLAGTTIEKAVEQAVELDGKVVLAFNGVYIPVGNKTKDEIIAQYHNWLEKQRETFTKKDVDDAYLKGVCDTKQELEKQSESTRTNIEIPFGACDSELQEVSY